MPPDPPVTNSFIFAFFQVHDRAYAKWFRPAAEGIRFRSASEKRTTITGLTQWRGSGRLRLPEISLLGGWLAALPPASRPRVDSWRDFVPPNLPKIADREYKTH